MRGYLVAVALLGAALAASGCATAFADSRCPMEGPDGIAYNLVIEGSAQRSNEEPDVDPANHLTDAYIIAHPASYPALPSREVSLDAQGCAGLRLPGTDAYRLIAGLTVWTGDITSCHWSAGDEFEFDGQPKVIALSLRLEDCGHYDCFSDYDWPAVAVSNAAPRAGEPFTLSVGPIRVDICQEPRIESMPFDVFVTTDVSGMVPKTTLLAHSDGTPANLTLTVEDIGEAALHLDFGDYGPSAWLNLDVRGALCPTGVAVKECASKPIFSENGENGTDLMERRNYLVGDKYGLIGYPDSAAGWQLAALPEGGNAWWSDDAPQLNTTVASPYFTFSNDALGHYAQFRILAPSNALGVVEVAVREFDVDLFVQPLAARAPAWQNVTLDLTSLAGRDAFLEFRYTTDVCLEVPCEESGVWVDDIEVV